MSETFSLASLAVPPGGELTQRTHAEPPHAYRSPFARDGARVVHARAFRRLAGKTQVFTQAPGSKPGDHFRSRLTHTLEVAQIARTLATSLRLNIELTETLALVHDIGHPPFGHAGEKALDHALKPFGLSFDHNLHALRIVTWFEERYPAFRGLNLTLGVREGIIKHSRDYSDSDHPELAEYFLGLRPPLEAQLIDLADEIAYLTADIEDGIDSGILEIDAVHASVPLFREFHSEAQQKFPNAPPRVLAGEATRRMVNALVTDLLKDIPRRVEAGVIDSLGELRHGPRVALFSPPMEAERMTAKRFLYANLYNSPDMELIHAEAAEVVGGLFTRFVTNPDLLPEDHREQVPTEGLARTVTDYIAGMTDSFIEQTWARLAS
ncbi:deoxyguanosinetriphosphate triphosphohydrolase family protein [Terracidiphilus gabretensis]|jgi:dGTPase|uniref:deoxyguanosinetriphosphate triphosphohydrolase family protein n=1 Tax=Terracidiphilus gabretensis TaxID=1577687 RepID=UPI00071B26EB|nr:dNTP triphosphohydrolase [Terracidiphilus gabretensis]